MTGRPHQSEAAPYYSTYIDKVAGEDPLGAIENQVDRALSFLADISEEKSLHRYAPGKWSVREVLSHVNDTERAFAFRALWFARGFESPLPSFDQDTAARGAQADRIPWVDHIDEFHRLRLSTISLFRNLSEDAWLRSGIASGNLFTVRALAYITAGHLTHHLEILRDRYL